MTKQASSAGGLAPPAGRGTGKHRRPPKHAAPVARRSAAEFGAANGRFAAQLTVIIPAYNEAASLADTVKSLVNQTTPPARVVVVDDCSTDGTGAVAAALGVEVLRPPANTGSKAGAQTFALRTVATRYVMAIDADTILAADAIEELSVAFADPGVAAACGLVLPRHVGTVRRVPVLVHVPQAGPGRLRQAADRLRVLFGLPDQGPVRAGRLVIAHAGRRHGPDLVFVRARLAGTVHAHRAVLPDRAAHLGVPGQAIAPLVTRLRPEHPAALARHPGPALSAFHRGHRRVRRRVRAGGHAARAAAAGDLRQRLVRAWSRRRLPGGGHSRADRRLAPDRDQAGHHQPALLLRPAPGQLLVHAACRA